MRSHAVKCALTWDNFSYDATKCYATTKLNVNKQTIIFVNSIYGDGKRSKDRRVCYSLPWLADAEIEFKTINATPDTDNHIKCFGFFTQHGNCRRCHIFFSLDLFCSCDVYIPVFLYISSTISNAIVNLQQMFNRNFAIDNICVCVFGVVSSTHTCRERMRIFENILVCRYQWNNPKNTPNNSMHLGI